MSKSEGQHIQQENQLTLQVAYELVALLKQPKIEVKYGSLNAILTYSKTDVDKKLFIGTQLFSEMIKVLTNQKLTTLCLSTLIHFSSLADFESELSRFVQPLIFNLKQWKDDLREELSLLCLLNISKYDSVIERLVCAQDQQKRGFLLEVIYGFIEIKLSKRWIVVNIFVNVTSIQVGRKYVTEEKVYLRFLDYLNIDNQDARIGILKLFRNCAFEWENEEFANVILDNKYDFVNKMGEHLLYLIKVGAIYSQTAENNEIIRKIFTEYQPLANITQKTIKQMKISCGQKALEQISLVIDILLVMSNCNFSEKKVEIKQEGLREIIGILKFSQLSEEYKDKLQALQIFCFY